MEGMPHLSEELFEQHYKVFKIMALAFAQSLGVSCEEAEDLYDEAILKAGRTYDPSRGTFKTHLFQCVVSKAKDVRLEQRRRLQREQKAFQLRTASRWNSDEDSPELVVRIRRTQEQVRALLRPIAPQHLDKMLLRLRGASWSEIDKEYGSQSGVAAASVGRKMKELRDAIQSGAPVGAVLRCLHEEFVSARATVTATAEAIQELGDTE